MKAKLIFVEHSHGNYEGVNYDKIVLSDGTLGLKCQNGTGKTDFKYKEGQEVNVTFKVRGSKNLAPRLEVTAIE